MRRLFRAVLPSVASVIFLCISSAEAKADHIVPVRIYNNPWTWTPAVTNLSTTTFEGLAPTNGSTPYPGGVTVNGVNVVSNNGATINAVDATAFGYSFSSGVALALPANSGFRINFANPVSAAGFDVIFLVGGQPAHSTLHVTLFKPNGQSVTITTPTFTSVAGFQGFVTDAISALEVRFVFPSFANSGGTLLLDNISFGQALAIPTPISDLPEPATLLLLGAGLAGVAVKTRSGRKGKSD